MHTKTKIPPLKNKSNQISQLPTQRFQPEIIKANFFAAVAKIRVISSRQNRVMPDLVKG